MTQTCMTVALSLRAVLVTLAEVAVRVGVVVTLLGPLCCMCALIQFSFTRTSKSFLVPMVWVKRYCLCWPGSSIIGIHLDIAHRFKCFICSDDSGKEGLHCYSECGTDGCWGPRSDECLSCKSFRLGDTCVSNCNSSIGYVLPSLALTC